MTSANRILDEALGGDYGESPIRFGLRDTSLVQPHPLADELPPAREPIEPIFASWRDVLSALAGFAVLVLIGVAFWLWMAIAAAAQVRP